MEQNPFADGPWGNCTCGWPRFRDGSCSNGECPDGGGFLDDDDITEEAPDLARFLREQQGEGEE